MDNINKDEEIKRFKLRSERYEKSYQREYRKLSEILNILSEFLPQEVDIREAMTTMTRRNIELENKIKVLEARLLAIHGYALLIQNHGVRPERVDAILQASEKWERETK